MSLLDWNLSPKENARIQTVLLDDERVVLVTRPRPQMDIVEAVGRVFSGVMLLVMLAYALCQMQQIWWLVPIDSIATENMPRKDFLDELYGAFQNTFLPK